jgi:hypothetical protein
MVRINFDVDKIDYKEFQVSVGYGNVSGALRQYIKSCVTDTDKKNNEAVLRKKFSLLDDKKKELDKEHNTIKIKLDNIEMKKKQEEIKMLEKQKEQKEIDQNIRKETAKANLWRAV